MFSALAGLLGFSALAGLLVTVMVAPALAVTGVTASSTIGIFDSLPDYIELGQQPERNTLYAHTNREGSVGGYLEIANIYDQNRQEVSYDEISAFARDAAVAGEDSRFYEHGGVDIASVVRAAVSNVSAGGIKSGSSTLSMQLVKQTFVQAALELPTQEDRDKAYEEATAQGFDRKLKEMKLAIALEKKYTKKEILTAYLNIAFYGANTYGIQAAAQRYFSVDAKDLTLPQAASLIAIVQYPGDQSLDTPDNYAANQERRDFILGRMLDSGFITQAEHDEAVAIPVDDAFIKPSNPQNGCIGANPSAKWFCDFVVKNVKNFTFLGSTEEERLANWKRGGYKLYTTLELDVQEAAQFATGTYAPSTEPAFNLGSATSTVQAGTGRVLVMTENKDFNDTLEGGGPGSSAVNFNTSVDYGGGTGFQSGSTYKVFTLLNWLASGKGLGERVSGDGRVFDGGKFQNTCPVFDVDPGGGPWDVKNDSGETGTFSILQGTAGSVNGVFANMGLQLDQCQTKKIATAMGVQRGDQTELRSNPAAILGTNEITPLSLASAFAALGANGKYCEPIVVDKAIAPDGTDLGGQPQNCRQAVDSGVAVAATYALQGVINGGTGGASDPGDGTPMAGKTGTTDDSNQTWMGSYTTAWGSAVWVGNWINKYPIRNYEAAGVSGGQLRHAITRMTAEALNRYFPGGAFPEPEARFLAGGGQAVPDVRGQSIEQAKALLESLGFVFVSGGPIDSDLPAGTVANSDPAPGTSSGKGSTVTVFPSKGNLVRFPDVVGDGTTYDFESAKAALSGAGYDNVQEVCKKLPADTLPDDPRDGKVVASDPAPGETVAPSAKVKLTVTRLTC